jgi:hypothetical protein
MRRMCLLDWSLKMRVVWSWIAVLLVTGAALAQSVQAGRSVRGGAYFSKGQAAGGGQSGPLTYAARTDMAVFGAGATGELLPAACNGDAACLANAYNASATTGHQGAALSYTGSPTQAPPAAGTSVSGPNINGLNSYLYGINTQVTDPDFGTTLIRATDYGLYGTSCLGGGSGGFQYNMGSAGGSHVWASDMSKIIIQSVNSAPSIIAFDPSTGHVTPSQLCGQALSGATTFAWTDPHTIYVINTDQENTVPFSAQTGTLITPETIQQAVTNATAELLAVNDTFVQLGPVTGTADNTHTWTGQTSGATFAPNASYPAPGTGASGTPYANTIFKGVINDSGAPSTWTVTYSLVFNFNYLPAMAGDAHFPAAQNNCVPQNYNANYSGVFAVSMDDTAFTVVFGDTGQANHTGEWGATAQSCTGAIGPGAAGNSGTHTCSGPVWVANYRTGRGCRAFNTMTDQIAGDWGPTGQALNGQANVIAGTITGNPTPGDALTQDATGATTQLNCLQNASGQCAVSGWTQALVGLIYGTADATHMWRDSNNGSSNYLAPSASPTNAPFYYPDVLHDLTQRSDPNIAEPTWVQQPNIKVSQVSYNASTHRTTISYSNSANYSWGQQFILAGLAGTHDSYLNCVSANQCPVWTVVAGGSPSTGITITDALGGSSDYADTEDPNAAIMTPNAQAPKNGYWELPNGGFGGLVQWNTPTLLLSTDYMATGHQSAGYVNTYQGKYYTAFNFYNPSTPCLYHGEPDGAPYPGPNTPCPNNANTYDGVNLLPFSITDDQHGAYGDHGTTDFAPVPLVTTLVCGLAVAPAAFACPTQYASVWDSEIIAVENAVTRSSPGNAVGLDCDYGNGPAPCAYRLGHTFNTNDNWNFAGQNAIGNMSPDGNWMVFPSDWNKTLGCGDGTTVCWSSWQATATDASQAGVSWSVDGNGNVTIDMGNSFCPTNGYQYWCVKNGSGTQSCGTNAYIEQISCGPTAGTVSLSGFSEAWLNSAGTGGSGTFSLGANTGNAWGCDSTSANAGDCTAFTGRFANLNPSHYNTSGTESSGTQKASVTQCGYGAPCQREDVWIARVAAAHQ